MGSPQGTSMSHRMSYPPRSRADAAQQSLYSPARRATQPATIPPPSMPPSSDRPWFERLPHPPGESPFRIKGTAYKGLLRFINTRLEGGLATFSTGLRDPALASFLQQPFLAGSFYDFLPMVAASCAVAASSHVPLPSFANEQGRAQATYDAENVYRAFVQGRSWEDLSTRFRLLCSRYYDFGEWDAQIAGESTMRFCMRGMPAWSLPWLEPMLSGYVTGLLKTMGIVDLSVGHLAPRRDGVNGGLATVTVEFEVSLRGST